MSFLFDDFLGSSAPGAPNWAAPTHGFIEFGGIQDLTETGGFLTFSPAPSIGSSKAGEMWANSVAPSADYYVEVVVAWVGSDSSGNFYFGARFAAISSWLTGIFINLTNHAAAGTTTGIDYQLVIRNASGSDNPDFASSGTLGSLSGTFRLEVIGTTINLKVNGTTVYTTTSSVVAGAGRPILASDGSANVNGAGYFKVDSIDCVNLGSSPTQFWTDYDKTFEVDA